MAKQPSMLLSISPITHEDLSNWELINQSDDDNDSLFGVQSFDLSESIHSLSSLSDLDDGDHVLPSMGDVVDGDKVEELDLGLINCENDDRFDVGLTSFVVNCEKIDRFDVGLINCETDDKVDVGLSNFVVDCEKDEKLDVGLSNLGVNYYGYGHDYDDDDVEEEDDDMDDELVPWEVKDVYMRQRIKKSGKKSMIKMDKSRKFLRCVKGKYGYGAALKPY